MSDAACHREFHLLLINWAENPVMDAASECLYQLQRRACWDEVIPAPVALALLKAYLSHWLARKFDLVGALQVGARLVVDVLQMGVPVPQDLECLCQSVDSMMKALENARDFFWLTDHDLELADSAIAAVLAEAAANAVPFDVGTM
jgi:hypothetical protein